MCNESLCKSQRARRTQTQDPCKALPWAPRSCELLDVMEVKKPGIARCFAVTQLCTTFVDQHLSRMLVANFPRMNCRVPADDHRISGQSVSS